MSHGSLFPFFFYVAKVGDILWASKSYLFYILDIIDFYHVLIMFLIFHIFDGLTFGCLDMFNYVMVETHLTMFMTFPFDFKMCIFLVILSCT